VVAHRGAVVFVEASSSFLPAIGHPENSVRTELDRLRAREKLGLRGSANGRGPSAPRMDRYARSFSFCSVLI